MDIANARPVRRRNHSDGRLQIAIVRRYRYNRPRNVQERNRRVWQPRVCRRFIWKSSVHVAAGAGVQAARVYHGGAVRRVYVYFLFHAPPHPHRIFRVRRTQWRNNVPYGGNKFKLLPSRVSRNETEVRRHRRHLLVPRVARPGAFCHSISVKRRRVLDESGGKRREGWL